MTGAVLAVGTVVTGSGLHAGDVNARRNGLDPAAIAQVHADLVFLLIGLAVATWLAFRAVKATELTVRAAWLLGIVGGQGLIGFVQYATGLPEILVGAHLAQRRRPGRVRWMTGSPVCVPGVNYVTLLL